MMEWAPRGFDICYHRTVACPIPVVSEQVTAMPDYGVTSDAPR